MTQEQQERQDWMLARMSSETFTFQQLWMHFGPSHGPAYREADRLIQRERKAGRIKRLDSRRWIAVGAEDGWNAVVDEEIKGECNGRI